MSKIRYLGERDTFGRPVVVVSSYDVSTGDKKELLDPRLDLAPGLVGEFDWGPAGRVPAMTRLCLAILADALAFRADGDELAMTYCRALRSGSDANASRLVRLRRLGRDPVDRRRAGRPFSPRRQRCRPMPVRQSPRESGRIAAATGNLTPRRGDKTPRGRTVPMT